MTTATYLDTSHPAPRFLSLGRALAGDVAVAAAAIARSSLRAVAAAAGFNRRQKAAALLSGLDNRLVRDLGFNHRDELLLVGSRRRDGRPGPANDNATTDVSAVA